MFRVNNKLWVALSPLSSFFFFFFEEAMIGQEKTSEGVGEEPRERSIGVGIKATHISGSRSSGSC